MDRKCCYATFLMKKISEFGLDKHSGPYDSRPLTSRFYRNGEATGTKLPGYVIEAQYQAGERFLIVTSWKCPFEEANDFVLLSETLKVLSKKSLGAMYETWLLKKHYPVSESELVFEYYDGGEYKLEIRQQRKLFFGSLLGLR